MRALRAQISPHFIYNSLSAIASFVRTDPDRARDLLLEFADFTRYSFRRHGEFTTLAEELRSIERYLLLEQARFGDRLQVTLQIAPEVLAVSVPFLCLQPLVENAVRHGLEAKRRRRSHLDRGRGRRPRVRDRDRGRRRRARTPSAYDGCSPATAGATRSGWATSTSGCGTAFGDEYGLVVETAPGAGTRVDRARAQVRPRSAPMSTTGRPARPRHRRRAARPRRAHLPARAATSASARCIATRLRRPTRCGVLQRRSRSTRSSSTSRCPGLDRARARPGAVPLQARRRPVVFVTAHDRARRRRLRAQRRRLRAQAGARGAPRARPYAGSPTRRAPRTPRGAASRSSSAGSPASCALADPLRRGRRATTPGCTRRTSSHLVRVPLTQLEQRLGRRRLRAHPPLAAGRAARTSTRCASTAAAARCVVGGTELPGRAGGTRRELRDLLVRRPARASRVTVRRPSPDRRPSGSASPARGPSGRGAAPRDGRPRRSTSRARSARSTCAR